MSKHPTHEHTATYRDREAVKRERQEQRRYARTEKYSPRVVY